MKKRFIKPLLALGLSAAAVAGAMFVQQYRSAEQVAAVSPAVAPEATNAAAVAVEPAVDAQPAEEVEEVSVSMLPSSSEPETSESSEAPASQTDAPLNTSAQEVTSQGEAEAQLDGWNVDYFEGFDGTIEEANWGQYGWGDPLVGHGAMGVMSQRNSFTQDGKLIIRTQYEDGQWSAGGASSGDVFTASRGRWEVRAKFPESKGLMYAFLLWPKDGSWPPEIDFAEGRANGPEVMGVYHWDPDDKQEMRFFDNEDMHGWHTYGVIVEDDYISFTFDGEEWGRIDHPSVTDKEMFIGFQTGAMDPNGWANEYETVDGGVPGPLTPVVSDIEIDYVAHYTRS